MGLFSRNKGQRQPSPPQAKSQPPAPAPFSLNEPVPAVPPPWAAPAVHPPSGLAATSPQPEPSPAQYQQQLFHQTYQVLQPHPAPYAGQLPHGSAPAVATGTAAMADEGGGGGAGGPSSGSLLRQAVRAAAREGKALTFNFVAQMQPVMANNPYGISMPNQHPYGPPMQGGAPAAGAPAPPQPPGDWQHAHIQPGPYDATRIPALPDMRDMPAELQDFRDQCATGVRQAVAMITAMEHQLWWERSRRQQAEEDCKVLLAAVRMERGVGEALLGAEERRRAEAADAATKLTLAADELPQASEAATTIQKHVRGHLARKEFESTLRDILRGVDPLLDPATLPAAAQTHVSTVNATGAPRRLGLRTLLGEAVDRASAGVGSQALPPEQAEAAVYYRRQVDRIGQRLAGHKDAGEPHPGDRSGDPLLADVKQLLTGSYPASSAQVIAALVRRCRELQAALLEAVGELEQAQLSIQGLKAANDRVSELSGVRSDLEASRQDNLRLAGTVARLRTALAAQAGASGSGGAGTARENPYVAAWYRKAYAEQEWQRVPPGGPGGVALMDGPDAAVETWDDLRVSVPEPVLVPKIRAPGVPYKDLLGLQQDMIMTAAQGPPDPLYTMPAPDRSAFLYERDTPLVPVQSAAPLIRESMAPVGCVGGAHQQYDGYRRSPRPSAAGGPQLQQQEQQWQEMRGDRLRPQEWEATAAAAGSGGGEAALTTPAGARSGGFGSSGGSGGGLFRYNRDTPVVPVYSVLPLIREDEFVRRSVSPVRDGRDALPPTSTPLLHPPYPAPSPVAGGPALSRQPLTSIATNMSYIRDRVQQAQSYTLPPAAQQQQLLGVPPEVAAAAAVAATMPPLAQRQASGGQMPPAAGSVGMYSAGNGHGYVR